MPQVKKSSVDTAILAAAFALFSEKGYRATSMPDIAARAGITPGNIYRYYRSKFELFYGVLEPWLDARLEALERDLCALDDGPDKLRRVLTFMWIDLPRAENNFELNLMQALASKKPDEPYSRDLLNASEKRIAAILEKSLPSPARHLLRADDLAHMMFMCHDGFVLNANLADETARIERMIEGVVGLVSGAPTV